MGMFCLILSPPAPEETSLHQPTCPRRSSRGLGGDRNHALSLQATCGLAFHHMDPVMGSVELLLEVTLHPPAPLGKTLVGRFWLVHLETKKE